MCMCVHVELNLTVELECKCAITGLINHFLAARSTLCCRLSRWLSGSPQPTNKEKGHTSREQACPAMGSVVAAYLYKNKDHTKRGNHQEVILNKVEDRCVTGLRRRRRRRHAVWESQELQLLQAVGKDQEVMSNAIS